MKVPLPQRGLEAPKGTMPTKRTRAARRLLRDFRFSGRFGGEHSLLLLLASH